MLDIKKMMYIIKVKGDGKKTKRFMKKCAKIAQKRINEMTPGEKAERYKLLQEYFLLESPPEDFGTVEIIEMKKLGRILKNE